MAFKKGQSGNPKGREPGKPVQKLSARRQLIAAHEDDLVSKAVSMALEGDTAMLKLCIDKILPSMKPVDLPINLPELERARGLMRKATVAVNSAASGLITTGEASDLLSGIGNLVKLEDHLLVKRELEELKELIKDSLPDGKG